MNSKMRKLLTHATKKMHLSNGRPFYCPKHGNKRQDPSQILISAKRPRHQVLQ